MLYNFTNEALFDADKKQIKNKFLNHLSFRFEHSFEELPAIYYCSVKLGAISVIIARFSLFIFHLRYRCYQLKPSSSFMSFSATLSEVSVIKN